MSDNRKATLANVLCGNVKLVSVLREWTAHELTAAGVEIGDLVLTESSLRKVVDDLIGNNITPKELQQWASFIRRGYLEGEGIEPVIPLSIRYDGNEDEMIDIISRFDEIGDLIDGEITDEEKVLIRKKLYF